MDIRKIALYLAGKLPPYYGSSNLRTFTKKLKEFAKEEFTNEEMLFIQQQAKGIDEEIYFMVLDDLRKNSSDNSEEGKKSKQDIISILKELNIPDEVFEYGNKLVFGEYKNEVDFTKNFVVPFFRKLGYIAVRYSHGQDEYGKDVIMKQVDKLGNRRFIGIQVKIDDIDGSAGGLVDKIIAQIKDGFKMSIKDLDFKTDIYISEFIVITNGIIARNAKEKILAIEDHSMRNNITFIDKLKIEDLLNNLQ